VKGLVNKIENSGNTKVPDMGSHRGDEHGKLKPARADAKQLGHEAAAKNQSIPVTDIPEHIRKTAMCKPPPEGQLLTDAMDTTIGKDLKVVKEKDDPLTYLRMDISQAELGASVRRGDNMNGGMLLLSIIIMRSMMMISRVDIKMIMI
jgi:hypothetical protein